CKECGDSTPSRYTTFIRPKEVSYPVWGSRSMPKVRHAALLIVSFVTALSAQQPSPAQAPAGPPRGSSAPPEHAKVTPINNLPNPYETIRNWGTLPDNRKWGSVSAIHVDADGKHIWAGDRCGGNACV